uniref:Ig-like domain-containing protein n=1 Tax=Acanthochromis polyacanthus TaxID=80966 RepID=A0A3Q1GEN6_9TELE
SSLLFILVTLLCLCANGDHYLYYRLGNDATLPCDDEPSSETTCSVFSWLHERNEASPAKVKVRKGKVNQNSPGADRLSLSRNCSLIINNITAEDAGRYTCRIRETTEFDTLVHPSILTSEYFDLDDSELHTIT